MTVRRGISCPEVFCDWCGRQITDGSRALWEAGESGRPTNGLFTSSTRGLRRPL